MKKITLTHKDANYPYGLSKDFLRELFGRRFNVELLVSDEDRLFYRKSFYRRLGFFRKTLVFDALYPLQRNPRFAFKEIDPSIKRLSCVWGSTSISDSNQEALSSLIDDVKAVMPLDGTFYTVYAVSDEMNYPTVLRNAQAFNVVCNATAEEVPETMTIVNRVDRVRTDSVSYFMRGPVSKIEDKVLYLQKGSLFI